MLQQSVERMKTYDYLRTKYHELHEQFTLWRSRYYLIACAWCQQRIGWKLKLGSVPGDTSHSICPSCVRDLLRTV